MNLNIERPGKTALLKSLEPDMDAINRHTLRPLTAGEVFVFRLEACNDQVDRQDERFPLETLEKLAPMFVGKTVIMDHNWSAALQTARIYDAEVVADGEVHQLMLSAYIPRTEAARDAIAAIEAGILKEVSVGCALATSRCSICGNSLYSDKCSHIKGQTYNGERCIGELLDPVDAYEVSFVAVPAQPGAGVKKEASPAGVKPAQLDRAKAQLAIEHERWK